VRLLPRRLQRERDALTRAKARLDTLPLYDRRVNIDRVRVLVAPAFFRIPGFRRYHGYALWRTILVRHPAPSDDLLTHELCHVWQGQVRPGHVLWSWLRHPYLANPYEEEARLAVASTRNEHDVDVPLHHA
jgi:hypothetical protein